MGMGGDCGLSVREWTSQLFPKARVYKRASGYSPEFVHYWDAIDGGTCTLLRSSS